MLSKFLGSWSLAWTLTCSKLVKFTSKNILGILMQPTLRTFNGNAISSLIHLLVSKHFKVGFRNISGLIIHAQVLHSPWKSKLSNDVLDYFCAFVVCCVVSKGLVWAFGSAWPVWGLIELIPYLDFTYLFKYDCYILLVDFNFLPSKA